MNSEIVVKEVPIEIACSVHNSVKEFIKFKIEDFENRYGSMNKMIIVAYYGEIPAGYIVGYDRDNDGSFYVWLAGVDDRYRRKGLLSALMKYQIEWAKKHGYNKLKLKTRNSCREMLAFLVKNNFNFVDAGFRENINDTEIFTELNI